MSKLELKIPPALVMVIIAYLMWHVSLRFSSIPTPLSFKFTAAVALLTIGTIIVLLGGVAFRKVKTTVNPLTPNDSSSLVIFGIYKYTRNPMYVGFFCFLIGWGLFLSNLYSLLVSISFILYINHFQIQPEERALETIFGEEYLEYKNRVRRWI